MKLLLRWALNAVALMLVPEVLTEIRVDGYAAALISALLLGFVNAIIRPVLAFSAIKLITQFFTPVYAEAAFAGAAHGSTTAGSSTTLVTSCSWTARH